MAASVARGCLPLLCVSGLVPGGTAARRTHPPAARRAPGGRPEAMGERPQYAVPHAADFVEGDTHYDPLVSETKPASL
jgi:hypothetical protein